MTYFVRTSLPLDETVKTHFATLHAAGTGGNQLAVMNNGIGTECLIKVNGAQTMPAGFTPTAIITNLDEARTLLASHEWTATA